MKKFLVTRLPCDFNGHLPGNAIDDWVELPKDSKILNRDLVLKSIAGRCLDKSFYNIILDELFGEEPQCEKNQA